MKQIYFNKNPYINYIYYLKSYNYIFLQNMNSN